MYVGYQSEWYHPPYNIGEGKAEHRYLAERSNIPYYRNLVAEQIAKEQRAKEAAAKKFYSSLDYIDPIDNPDFDDLWEPINNPALPEFKDEQLTDNIFLEVNNNNRSNWESVNSPLVPEFQDEQVFENIFLEVNNNNRSKRNSLLAEQEAEALDRLLNTPVLEPLQRIFNVTLGFDP